MDITIENVTTLIKEYGALQQPHEALQLVQFLSKRPMKLFLEVGVYTGGLAAIIKTFFPEVEIIGVDVLDLNDPTPFPPNTMENVELLKSNIEKFGINYISGNSTDPETIERVEKALAGRKADFLFIDAAHDYDNVKKDFFAYHGYAKVTGFHDLHNDIGPWKVWLEIKDDYKSMEIPSTNGHLGIGLILE